MVTHEDMPYEMPEWLRAVTDATNALPGMEIDAAEGGGETMMQRTAEISSGYFSLYLEQGAEAALDSFQDYLGRFAEGNRQAGILTPVMAEQFGLLANIASLRYDEADRDQRQAIIAKIEDYLSKRSGGSVSAFTAQLRNPLMLRDLVLHDAATNLPSAPYGYRRFLRDAEWPEVTASIEDPSNNPIVFGIFGLLDSTAPDTRSKLRDVYPELVEQSLNITAARLFCEGAHEEILMDQMPEMYNTWEETIQKVLLDYAEEFRPLILQRLAETDWASLLLDPEFSFDELYQKLATTRFLLTEDGRLERYLAGAAPLENDADSLGENR